MGAQVGDLGRGAGRDSGLTSQPVRQGARIVTVGIEIRELVAADLVLLCAAGENVFDNPVLPDQARAFLADPANLIVVALKAGHIAAMATGTVLRHPDKPPSLFVNEVSVRDDLHRQGIGAAIMARVLAAARARGCDGAWVATEDDNTAARALYRRAGGHETEGIVMYEWDGLTDDD